MSARPVYISVSSAQDAPEGFDHLAMDTNILFDHDVPEIRVVGVLERLSHTEVPVILSGWAQRLTPGGWLKLSVPDFEPIARGYLEGQNLSIDHEVLGPHLTEDDCFGSAYDWAHLAGLLRRSGLICMGWWTDAAPTEDRRLNMKAMKPLDKLPKFQGVMSIPRLGWNDFWGCALSALAPLGVGITTITGAYWEQCLEKAVRQTLEEHADVEYLLFLDYDSIFTSANVIDLVSTAAIYPEVDALAPVQAHRYLRSMLMTLPDENGGTASSVPMAELMKDITPAKTAHLGCTLVRRGVFDALPAPWFRSEPAEDGFWKDGKIDADIAFWYAMKEQGFQLYLANRIPIGHLENMIRWPDGQLRAVYQHPNDFKTSATPPRFVWR